MMKIYTYAENSELYVFYNVHYSLETILEDVHLSVESQTLFAVCETEELLSKQI